MAVKLRLRRMGGRNRPFYRIVAADQRFATDGRFLENLGWYDPTRKMGENFELNVDRVAYWRGHGAHLSDTVKAICKLAEKRPPKGGSAAPGPADETAAETDAAQPGT